jgi:predicted  nucleic acid-binding Zn-ribbon protein
LSITGFFQCTALFAIVPQVPRDINCPVLLVGFPSPRQAERLEREFEEFCGKRDFPCLDLKAIARQRVRLESRNRDYLIQTTRMRQALEDRYARADELLQKREQQMEMLTKEAEAIIRAREAPQPPHRTPLVERTIDRIDRAINEITAYVGRLAETANGKSEGRPMTRKEELALLERLKNEVRETRQQLDALNEQLS